jgi:tetratricopeptide (TPR) repeat protein
LLELRAAAEASQNLGMLAEGLIAAGSLEPEAAAAAALFSVAAVVWRRDLADLPRAVDALGRAFAVRPADALLLADLAALLLQQGDVERLLEAYASYVTQIPENDRGAIYETMGRLCAEELGDAVRAQWYVDLARATTRRAPASSPKRRAPLPPPQTSLADIDALERLLSQTPLDRPAQRAQLLHALGEAHLSRGERERADESYLKAIDLDASHAPTLRRVIDHYWSVRDLGNVAELGAELERLGELFVEGTPASFVARIAVAAASEGADTHSRHLIGALGQEGPLSLAIVLVDLAGKTPDSVGLLSLVERLCQPPGPSLLGVREALVAHAKVEPAAASLLRLLSPLGVR